jgi:hypothetical protein
MNYIIIIGACIFALWMVAKLFSFFKRGGTFTQVTRNVSYLYYQGRLVYPKLREDAVRYIAIMINSASNRSHFPKDRISRLVLSHSCNDWASLCMEYSWEYSTSCGGPSPQTISHDVVSNYNDKILQTISWVENQVKNGGTRSDVEMALRKMNQMELIGVTLELEKYQ